MTDVGDKPRWGLSLAVVLAVHGAAAVAMVSWAAPAAAPLPPPTAILVDLAPPPVAAPASEPPQQQEEPQQEELPREEPQQAEPPPPPDPVPLPKPPPRPKPTPKKTMPRPQSQPAVQPAVSESVAPAEAPMPVAAPPRPVSTVPSPAVSAWHQALLKHLDRHRRYPAAARQRRQEGTSQALFSIDRQGRVVASRLQTSSGHELLDRETLELLQRAQPLPPPPAEVAGELIELSVPVRFSLK